MALTDEQKRDFAAPHRDGELMPVPVAKAELIPAGTIVCINAKGFAVGGKEAVDLVYAGRAEERADNREGNDGEKVVLVRRKKAFRWLNDGSITQAMLGKRVYVLNNRTLTATDGADSKAAKPASRSHAGVVIMLESDGVWIE